MRNEIIVPVLVIFKKVVRGDLRKFLNESNDADTGGGARDLRFRYTKQLEIKSCLDKMFDRIQEDGRTSYKDINWTSGGNKYSTQAEYWQATDARPGELRIAKISSIQGWYVSLERFEEAEVSGRTLFYLLTLDESGKLWARIFDSKYLESTTSAFKLKITEVLSQPQPQTKQGVVTL